MIWVLITTEDTIEVWRTIQWSSFMLNLNLMLGLMLDLVNWEHSTVWWPGGIERLYVYRRAVNYQESVGVSEVKSISFILHLHLFYSLLLAIITLPLNILVKSISPKSPFESISLDLTIHILSSRVYGHSNTVNGSSTVTKRKATSRWKLLL